MRWWCVCSHCIACRSSGHTLPLPCSYRLRSVTTNSRACISATYAAHVCKQCTNAVDIDMGAHVGLRMPSHTNKPNASTHAQRDASIVPTP